MAILAVDIGGTRTRAALLPRSVGDAGKAAGRLPESALTPAEMAPRAPGERLPVAALLEFLAAYAASADPTIEAVGVSVAGVLSRDRGTVRQALNLGWTDVPLRAQLGARFGCPVVLDTDSFAAACAEARLGHGRGQPSPTFLFVTIGTGVGHALVLEGRLWRGVHGAASTFGHLRSRVAGGAACYCGGRGCLCQYASGRGLTRLARRYGAPRGIRDGAAVVAAAARGERWAQQAVGRATDALALSLSQALAVVDCGTAVIGGGAVSAQWPVAAQLRERVQDRLHPQVRVAEISLSRLAHAPLRGAALEAGDLLAEGESR